MMAAGDALTRMVRRMFPASVGIGVSDPQADYPLLAPEQAATSGMVPARLREFAAGRHAARVAMRMLGHPDQAILMGSDRAPIWPAGMQGSISHSATTCVAVMTLRQVTLGIDLEPDAPLEDGLVALICTPREQDWLHRQPAEARGQLARLIFSAKESVYKAQYPHSRQIIDFRSLCIALDQSKRSFVASFNDAVGPFDVDHQVTGHAMQSGGLIVTGLMMEVPGTMTQYG